MLVYLKASNFCNVGCSHCYLPESIRANKTHISPETLQHTLESAKVLADRGGSDVEILWHGGEALSVAREWYEEAFVLIDNILGPHKESMQTSLIPYTSRWADLVKRRFGGFLGISVDFFTRQINGSSQQYLDLLASKIDLARADGIEVGATMTLSQKDLGRELEITEWYLKHEFLSFQLERYNDVRDLEYVPTRREHAQALLAYFTIAMALFKSGVTIGIEPLNRALDGILNHKSGGRWGTTCSKDFMVVSPNGNTHFCPTIAETTPAVSNVSFGPQKVLEAHRALSAKVSPATSACFSCRHFTWCGGGCPIEMQSDTSDCTGFGTLLEALERFIETPENRRLAEDWLASVNSMECSEERGHVS